MIPIFGEKGALYACVPIALIGAIFTFCTKTKPKEVFPFALPPIKTFFGAILLTIGVKMFSTAISVAVSLIFDSNARSADINSILTKMSPLTAIIVVAVLPAICEEFFCRGFLVRCFSQIKSEKLIILIVAVIFGVMHLDPYSFFYTAIFGGLWCYIALKTKSLLIPIFLHFSRDL
jgi:sodium transport system permease protein